MVTQESKSDAQSRADELQEHGDVPEVRAHVVALREAGYSHREVAEALDLSSGPSQSAHHCRLYREQREDADWLLTYGPEI